MGMEKRLSVTPHGSAVVKSQHKLVVRHMDSGQTCQFWTLLLFLSNDSIMDNSSSNFNLSGEMGLLHLL